MLNWLQYGFFREPLYLAIRLPRILFEDHLGKHKRSAHVII